MPLEFGANNRTAITIVIILIFASAYLSLNIDSYSYWEDEIATIQVAEKGFFQIPSAIISNPGEPHPPLQYLYLALWMPALSSSDISYRLPFLFAAICGIYLFFFLTRTFFSEKAALISTFLLAFSPYILIYTRMARHYPIDLFCGLLSTSFFLIILYSKDNEHYLYYIVGYILSTALLLYSFIPNIALIIAQVSFFFIREFMKNDSKVSRFKQLSNQLHTKSAKALVYSWFSVFLLFLPWILFNMHKLSIFQAGSLPVVDAGIKEFLMRYAITSLQFTLGQSLYPWNILAIILIPILIGAFLWGLVKSDREKKIFAFCFIFINFFIIAICFQVFATPFSDTPARAMVVFPYFIVFTGWGISSLNKTWPQAIVIIAIAICFAGAGTHYFDKNVIYDYNLATPTKEIALDLQEKYTSSDMVIYHQMSSLDYYWISNENSPQLITLDNFLISSSKGNYPVNLDNVVLVIENTDSDRQITPKWEEIRELLSISGYEQSYTNNLVEVDANYRKFKEMLLNTPSYQYRMTIEGYEKRDDYL